MLLAINNLIEYLNRNYLNDDRLEEEVNIMTKTLYDPEVEKRGDEFYLCFTSHSCGMCDSCKRMMNSSFVEMKDIEFSIHLIPNIKTVEKETKEIDVLKNYIISSGEIS